MIHIARFFEKFAKISPPEKFIKDSLRATFLEKAGVLVDPREIQVKGGTAYLSVDPGRRSEIFLQKQEILRELSSALGPRAPKDIR